MAIDDETPWPLPTMNVATAAAVVAASYEQRAVAAQIAGAAMHAHAGSVAAFASQLPDPLPGLLLQTLIVPGGTTPEGVLVEAVGFAWCKVLEEIKRNPSLMHEIPWRAFEKIIAGAWEEWSKPLGGRVTLTPASGDNGVDVIIDLPGAASVRLFDQVKRYAPGQLVTAESVNAMLGVLDKRRSASKGLITTTADFAPGVLNDPELQPYMPGRLELRPREKLLAWLEELAARKK